MAPRQGAALTAGTVGITILAMGDAFNAYSGLLPSMFTISSDFFNGQGSRQGNIRRIRQGEIIATGASLGIGFGASLAAGSYLPLWGTAIACAGLLICYEYALRHPASEVG
jgi:hypothetical protein